MWNGERLRVLWMLLVMVLLTACGGKNPPAAVRLMLSLQPHGTVNNGQVFYLVVKEVEEDQFAKDTYEAVASLVVTDNPGPDVLGIYPVIPGMSRKVFMDKPSHKPLGLYFLYTTSGGDWKRKIAQPLADKYNIVLDKDEVSVKERMGAW